MATTTQNEVRFNDGEALVLSDMHDMQRFLKAMVFDQGFGASPRLDLMDSGFPTATLSSFALTPHAGSAYPTPNATVRGITNTAGMVYQWVSTGAPDGEECNLLGYQLAADELVSTFAANASGNPRIDALCIKLSYDDAQDSQTRDFQDAVSGALSSQTMDKKRRTVCAVTTVTGTAAATPTIPSAPAGYCVFAYAYIPNGFASVLGHGNLWDNRMPMRVGSARTYARSGLSASGWTLSANGYNWTNSAATSHLYLPFPRGGECRILGVNFFVQSIIGTGAVAKLGRIDIRQTSLQASSDLIGTTTGQETMNDPFSSIRTPMYLGKNGNGPAYWGNGYSCGAYVHSQNPFSFNGALVADLSDANGSADWRVNGCEWIYAY